MPFFLAFGKVLVVTSLGDRRCEYLPSHDVPIPRHADRTVTRVLEFFLGGLPRFGKLGLGAPLIGLLLGRVAPVLAAVWFEINFSKDSIHVAGGNGIDQATFFRLVGKLLPGPGGHRTATVFRRFTGDADQAHNLFGGEFSRRAAPRSIAETHDDRPSKRSIVFGELHPRQGPERVSPASSPEADHLAGKSPSAADRLVVVLLKCHQNDLCSRHDGIADVSARRQLE